MRTTEQTFDRSLTRTALPLKARVAVTVVKIASLLRVFRNRREISNLSELTDSQLLDIGLTRHEVRLALTTSTFFEDPSSRLTYSARRRARQSGFNSIRD